jgi:hypothetical protein
MSVRWGAFLLAFVPASAAAQEIDIRGPVRGCILTREWWSVPAPIEPNYWLSGGAVSERVASGSVGAGAELTTGIKELGEGRRSRGALELRLGPWAQVAAQNAGGLVEGGATLHLGSVDDHPKHESSLFMFDVRAGGGYGSFVSGRTPFVALALAWGFRTVIDRHTVGGACDPEPRPPLVAEASAVRIVTTVRRAVDFPASELGLALEVSFTSFLLPWRISEEHERPSR